jgi:hypothetical protein
VPVSNAEYARHALEIIARDDPPRHAALIAAIRALPGLYGVGDETFAIFVRAEAIVVGTEPPALTVLEIAIDPPEVIGLLDGTASVETLLAEDRLRVRASADALLDLARLVSTTLRGALRLRALQDLFDDYRGWVGIRAEPSSRARPAPR